MRIWTVANQKGGVGKTTTTVTLAGLLNLRGERVLVVDMDPQGSLTAYFGLDVEDMKSSVYTLFEHAVRGTEPPGALYRNTRYEGLSLLPASSALATLDRQLGGREGMGLVLARALRRIAGGHSQVIIDCPPMVGVLMVNALAACEHLIVPVQTEFLALKGLERMMRTVDMITRARRIALPCTVVPTMFDAQAFSCLETLRSLREAWAGRIWSEAIPLDPQFRDASRAGVPLPLINADAAGVRAYQALLDQLLRSDNAARRAAEAS